MRNTAQETPLANINSPPSAMCEMSDNVSTTPQTLFSTLAEDNTAGILRFADYPNRDPIDSRAYHSLFLSPRSVFREIAAKSFSVLKIRWSKHFAVDFQFADADRCCIIFDTCIMFKTARQVLRAYGSAITKLEVSNLNYSNMDHWEPSDLNNFASLIANLCPLLCSVSISQCEDSFARQLLDQLQDRLKSVSLPECMNMSIISTCLNLRHLSLYSSTPSSLDELWISLGATLERLDIHVEPSNWTAFCTGLLEHCRNIRYLKIHVDDCIVSQVAYSNLLRSYGEQLIDASLDNLNALNLLQIARSCPNLRCQLNINPSQFSRVLALSGCIEKLCVKAEHGEMDRFCFLRGVEKCTQMTNLAICSDNRLLTRFDKGPVTLPRSATHHLEVVHLNGLCAFDCNALFDNCSMLKKVTITTKIEQLNADLFAKLARNNSNLQELYLESWSDDEQEFSASLSFDVVLARIVNELKFACNLKLFTFNCSFAKWRANLRDVLMPLRRFNTKCSLKMSNGNVVVYNGRLVFSPVAMRWVSS